MTDLDRGYENYWEPADKWKRCRIQCRKCVENLLDEMSVANYRTIQLN